MSYPYLSEKYEIVDQIGQGSFGKSYLARKNDTNELVVIKIIENDKFWQKLKDDEQLLCSVDNEYIMHIYAIETSESYKYIIQEHIQGITLNTYISNNDLTLKDLLNISYGVLNAIKYLEILNLSHKDIKPANIMYNKDRKILKLIDLDYMSIQALSDQNYIGTIKYSSPEQIMFNKPSSKADIYSFGMVLCFMILGNIPFDVNLRQTACQMKAEVEGTLKEITGLNKDIINKIVYLVEGLLEYKPEKRLTPSKAIQQIENIIKKSEEENQGGVIIHEHIDGCNYIFNKSTNFVSMVDTSVVIMSLLEVSDHGQESTSNNSGNEKKCNYFREDSMKIDINKRKEENRNIYQKQLLKEYDNILFQAKVSFGLWVFSFFVCFTVIFISVFSIIKGNYTEGLITIVLDCVIVAIQKLFNIREDYYRKLMEQKIKHLETGDYLDYAFEKVEKLDNPKEKNREILELIKTIREQANKYGEKEEE